MSVPVVQVNDVSKRFILRKEKSLKERIVNAGRSSRFKEDFWALRNVSLEIESGTTIGLIGSNGSGKSTLLKAIGGILEPTSGSVRRRGRLAALLELGAGFHPDLTGRENVYLNASILGLSRKQTDFFFDDIVEFSGIENFIDTQVKFYSSGMYVRLAFAVAIHVDPDLLLVDEVLAVGDEAFQRKCLDKIRSFQAEGRTIVLVTHSLGQVAELCDRAVLLNAGSIVFDGDTQKATAKFRDILEDRRLDELSQHPEELVNQGQILDVSVRVVGKEKGAKVQAGDDLEVSMTFEHKTGLDTWMAGLQIDSGTGQTVYGTSTKRAGLALPPLREAQTVVFHLRNTHFGTGKYFISASLMSAPGVHLHDLIQAVSFDVPYYDLALGTVYTDTEVTVG
ncbi:ABC transporter ATP-binding protein [Clavibacter michiganensis]|nr:ABC transporter ATP-binding protein [Clavibacter michiganensis]PPF60984.1 ABC transporter ATP-binding protein [Clavibacter michiganensis]